MSKRALHDRHIVLAAIAIATGALVPISTSTPALAVAVLAALIALAARRPLLLAVALCTCTSMLAARSWAGLERRPARVIEDQWATLLTDPATVSGGSTGVELRLGHQRVSAFARGAPADAISRRLAGERVRLSGSMQPVTGVLRQRLAPRHIAMRLTIADVSGSKRADPMSALANSYRRLVVDGARVLPEALRPLFGGMVLGDDRGQSAELQDAFRAAGLTHLMVVSGQNVAFALLVASPLIRRGGLRWRLFATIGVLVAFGVLTRWEPSVLRAEAMAVVAATGTFVGRPAPAVRVLALAAGACMLVDPLLVHSVGFRLSVAACAGLVALTPPLQRRGVPMLLAASIAAQTGAAVVLVPTFGTVPLTSLPANVLAVPLAGPLMMWGLTAGPVAGLVPALRSLIHLPTHLILWWVAGVARWAAHLPVAPIGAVAALALAVGALGLGMGRATGRRLPVVTGALVTFAVVVSTLRPPSPVVGAALGPGTKLWVVDGRAVLAMGGRLDPRLLDELRARRVLRLDVLVVTKAGPAAADAAWPVVQAMRPRVVLAPEHHQLAKAKTARVGATVAVGGLVVRITGAGPPLELSVNNQAAAAVYGQRRDASAW